MTTPARLHRAFPLAWLLRAAVAIVFACAPLPGRATEPVSHKWGATLSIHGIDYEWSQAESDETGNLRRDRYVSFDSATNESNYVEVESLSAATAGSVGGYHVGMNDHIAGVVRSIAGSISYLESVQTLGENPGATVSSPRREYFRAESVITNWVDGNGVFKTSTTELYRETGTSETPSEFTVDASGVIAGSEEGFRGSGTFYFNYSEEPPLEPSIYPPNLLFGRSYSYVPDSGSSSIAYTSVQGAWRADERYEFSAENGATCTIHVSRPGRGNIAWGSIDGNDPVIGDFSGGFSGGGFVVPTERSGPSFAQGVLANNQTALVWRSGVLDPTHATATVTDTYLNQNGSIRVTITGNLNDKFEAGGDYDAQVTVLSGGVSHSATFNCLTGVFDGYYLVSRTTRDTSILGAGDTVWVNGSRYAFKEGFTAQDGSASDEYTNASFGRLLIYCGTTNPDVVRSFTVSYHGSLTAGDYTASTDSFAIVDGNFELHITTAAPSLPPVFWADGVIYYRGSESTGYYDGGPAGALVVSGIAGAWVIEGGDGARSFTGAYVGGAGVFAITYSDDTPGLGYPAAEDGAAQLAPDGPDNANLPPGVTVLGCKPWVYLGKTGDNWYYAYAGALDLSDNASSKTAFLSINSAFGVVFRDTAAANSICTGSYNPQTHLFQSSTDHPMPMPTYGCDPQHDFSAWGFLAAPRGRPATVLIGGQTWRLARFDPKTYTAIYDGYYVGESLSIAGVGRDGVASVVLTRYDSAGDAVTEAGTFLNGVFHGIFEAAGVSGIKSGSIQGEALTSLDAPALNTFNNDLDITGNLFSLGSWAGNASHAGLTLQYRESGSPTKAVISLTSSRGATSWLWSHATSDGASNTQPAMLLNSEHALKLYNSTDSAAAKIVLDPGGVSEFTGVLRVGEYGDISMGGFRHKPAGR